jgi:streptogramin lyase
MSRFPSPTKTAAKRTSTSSSTRSRLGGLLAAAVGLTLWAGCAGDGGGRTDATQAPRGPVQAIIAVGHRPGVPVAGEGAVWVPNTADGSISRIDPRTNRVVATLRIGDQPAFYHRSCEAKWNVHAFMGPSFHVRDCDLPSAVAVGSGALWVLKNDDPRVLRIDPKSGHIVGGIPLSFLPFDIAATNDGVWITGYYDDAVVRIDPKTNHVVANLTVPDGASGIAVGAGAVWVASSIGGTVTRIDPATNRVVATVTLDCPARCDGSVPLAVAATAEAVWVRTVGDGLVARIDPQTNRVVTTIAVTPSVGRDGQDHLVVQGGSLWVSGISLQRIDPLANHVAGTVDVNATSVNAGFGSLWITDVFGRVERINPAG